MLLMPVVTTVFLFLSRQYVLYEPGSSSSFIIVRVLDALMIEVG